MSFGRPSRAAVNEAGHAVVGSALGRKVELVKLGTQAVPDDHPQARTLKGSIAGGETRFAPNLVSELRQRYAAGLPYTREQVEWLRTELVTCFAGVMAEVRVLGGATRESGLADMHQAAVVVNNLGISQDADSGERRVGRAEEIAQTIVNELATAIERVATTFSSGGGTFDASTVGALLERAGVRRGSHRHLLEDLAA
jgi:hypothetical protein